MTASLSEIKKELGYLEPAALVELCLRLSKYKKENKELLHYLLFEAHDEAAFIEKVKLEMDEQLGKISIAHSHLAKKTLRKVLRTVVRYTKFSGSRQAEVEWILHFCRAMKASRMPVQHYPSLHSIYQRQLEKLNRVIGELHEDLQYDYRKEVQALLSD